MTLNFVNVGRAGSIVFCVCKYYVDIKITIAFNYMFMSYNLELVKNPRNAVIVKYSRASN